MVLAWFGCMHMSCLVVRRGKLLNVREANLSKVGENTEIQNIKQIMGLQHGKVQLPYELLPCLACQLLCR